MRTTDALSALHELERAFAALVGGMRLPSPLPDHGLGTSDALDLYLNAEGPTILTTGTDPAVLPGFDRVSTFCLLGAPAEASLPRVATQCVAEAIANRLDASETPDLRRAMATELWWIRSGLADVDIERIADAQAHPERTLASRELEAASEGRAILLDYLETHLSPHGVGDFVASLFTLAASETPPAARNWQDEPDAFDVIRHTLEERPSQMARLMGNLAVERAFLGQRDDGTHWATLKAGGSLVEVRYDWKIPWSSLPRRLAPGRPLEPLGAMYLRIDLDEVPLNATLGFQAEWEPPVAMQWVLVRLGRDGRELGRLVVPFQERGTMAEQRLVDVADAAAVLVVGTNLGGTDLAHPFDPDIAPFEAHGCTVFLAAL